METSRDQNRKELSKLIDKKLADKLENSIYEFSDKYSESQGTAFLLDSIYEEKFNEILCLLKSNKKLIDMIKNKKIDPEQIPYMKSHELNPEKYEKINKKREIEEKNIKDKPTTDLFECKKCKKRRCTVEERQTRAGDEPATQFIDCLECGHKWRIG